MINRFKSQALTAGLLIAVALAYYFPSFGATGGALKPEITTNIVIALIFFFQGSTINSKSLLESVVNYRLHIFCQTWVFVLAPLLMLLIVLVLGPWIPNPIKPGLLFLSVLPSTILSSVIFTASSKGDAAAALFNATLSNFIGILATPLWCLALFARVSGEFPPVGSLILKIATYILLPVILGQWTRTFARNWIETAKPAIKRLNTTLILFVVYAAFCDSFANGVWDGFGASSILAAVAYSALFLGALSCLVWMSSTFAASNAPQRVAAFYCGSQKTLAAGIPMASVIFAGQSGPISESVIILPLMVYHTLQLFLGGALIGTFTQTTQKS